MFSESKVHKYAAKYLEKDVTNLNTDPEVKKTIWRSILEVIYKDREDILYKRNNKGGFIYNDNGFRKIDTLKIIFNLAQLISGLIIQFKLEKQLSQL